MNGNPNVFEARNEGPKVQEVFFPFSKQKIIYLQKTKDEFSASYCEKSNTGTWSTSSLIPHKEDIIPRWSQLLTSLFSRGKKDHGEGKIMVIHNTLVKFYGKRIAQDAKNEELSKDPTVQSGKERINGLYCVFPSNMRGE